MLRHILVTLFLKHGICIITLNMFHSWAQIILLKIIIYLQILVKVALIGLKTGGQKFVMFQNTNMVRTGG